MKTGTEESGQEEEQDQEDTGTNIKGNRRNGKRN